MNTLSIPDEHPAWRVLMIEDDSEDYLITRDLFTEIGQGGITLEWVSTYQAGLEALQANRHDVCLMDYRLGEGNGLELMSEAFRSGCRVPIIILTGQGDHSIDVAATQAGAAEYLIKGKIGVSLLEHAVRYAIQHGQTLEALRESEERYELAVCGSNDGIWDWKLEDDTIFFSARWKAMLGYGEQDLSMRPGEWFDRVHPEDVQRLQAEIKSILQDEAVHLECEYRIRHRDQTFLWVLCRGMAVRDSHGKAIRIAGSQTDITQHRLYAEQIQHQALYDTLTNLPNRALFLDRLGRTIARADRSAVYAFAVIFLDIDRFKIINDSLGHAVGDQLLVSIARRLETCLPPGDTVARLSGDEFALLLEDTPDPDAVIRLVGRIQEMLSLPCQLQGHELLSTASMGIAFGSKDSGSAEDILRDADTAMCRAKIQGKARYVIFDTSMHVHAVALLQLEFDLRRAIEQNQLCLHYQPIWSVSGGNIVGVEALVRWQHPLRGLLAPQEFISLAEESNLIVALGEWVIRHACQQHTAWIAAGCPAFRLAINLSVRQFQHRQFIEMVEGILQETGMDRLQLEFEITESVAMNTVDSSIVVAHKLRALGAQLSIDDFGTGYSSLSYLRRIPLHTLKIDQSFVADIASSNDAAAITRAIIALGNSLKLRIVAEGVETAEQLAFLRSQGCDEVQGFLLGRPLPAEMLTPLLFGKTLISGGA